MWINSQNACAAALLGSFFINSARGLRVDKPGGCTQGVLRLGGYVRGAAPETPPRGMIPLGTLCIARNARREIIKLFFQRRVASLIEDS